jgi:hypothetical protein
MQFFAQGLEKVPFKRSLVAGLPTCQKNLPLPRPPRRGSAVPIGKNRMTQMSLPERAPEAEDPTEAHTDRSPASSQSQYRNGNFHTHRGSRHHDSLTPDRPTLRPCHPIALDANDCAASWKYIPVEGRRLQPRGKSCQAPNRSKTVCKPHISKRIGSTPKLPIYSLRSSKLSIAWKTGTARIISGPYLFQNLYFSSKPSGIYILRAATIRKPLILEILSPKYPHLFS